MGMIKKFDTYNESIRDQMTSKNLSDNQQLIYDAAQDLESIDIPASDIKSDKGTYSFNIYNYDEKITVYYTDEEEIKDILTPKAFRKQQMGWHLYISRVMGGKISRKLVIPEEDSWDFMFLTIINIYYKNPSQKREDAMKSIITLEDKIEKKKELIETLDKVIEIKNKLQPK